MGKAPFQLLLQIACDGGQSVELVTDFPRAAKQAQIELYLDERPVIMIKNLVFSVSVDAIFLQMAALLTGSKGGFHGTPLTPPVSATALGGLNIRQASLHAPAAFIGSFHQSEPLISEILGHPARMPQHLPNTISALAKAAARPEWLSIQCIDVSLHSHSLFRAVDEASYSLLLDSSLDVRSRALALSSAISHAGDWLNVVPSTALGLHLLDCEF